MIDRVGVLEGTALAIKQDWTPVLDRLTDAELTQLEAIVTRLHAGEEMAAMSHDDRELAEKVERMAV